MTGEARMLAAARLEPVDATPIWFMRQAGRCFAEYRQLRERYEILTIARTPELSAEVTLLPVERLHVDGAVLFADIMLPLEGMGVEFVIEPEVGPIIREPLRTAAAIEQLRVIEAQEATPYVFDAIRLIRRELAGRAAVVGFAGGPFTLACYLVDGRPSRDFPNTKALMLAQPALWHRLMETLTEVVVRYLREQVAAGAQVVQLFDSWAGVLGPTDYERAVLPYTTRIFAEIGALGVPTIHFSTGTSGLLELIARAGSSLVSLDWRDRIDRAWERIGYDRGVQGNLEPAVMLAPWTVVEARAREILSQAGGRRGHIFNLGHGVLPETSPDDLARLVDLVHAETASPA
jgi:uroporphyrinogen decarboxylase